MRKSSCLMAVISIGLMACGGSNNESVNSKSENDSIIEAISEVEETVEEAAPTFLSADLKMFGLKGKVKKVSAVSYQKEIEFCDRIYAERPLQFDTDGKWNKNDFNVFIDLDNECNNDGFLSANWYRDSDSSTYEEEYEDIDDNGWAHKETYVSEEMGYGSFKHIISYEYSELDEKGNWIGRKVIVNSVMEDYEGNKTKNHNNWIETRTITYYE